MTPANIVEYLNAERRVIRLGLSKTLYHENEYEIKIETLN